MGFRCGIVGLPNVGKSTLFNALTKTAAAQAANFPFCTIEPNIGDVAVPDPRLDALADIASSAQRIPARLSFVDIAGLVRGASKGEGLGNQFLGNIREVDAIAHVLRCFEDGDVTHVEGRIDPLADADTVDTELMLSDLESLEKREANLRKKATTKDKDAIAELELVDLALAELREGRPARCADIPQGRERDFKSLQLITAKPVIYVCNVEEDSAADGNSLSAKVAEKAAAEGAEAVVISARIEEELAQLDEAERLEYLDTLGLSEPGLNRLIRQGYNLLELITYFTAGPKEARAWTIARGTSAPQAAGVIHTDFERGFIRAETIGYDDYTELNGEQGARDAGKLRQEGKEYVVQDGDVMLFRFNV
ncbi:MAG TPA: redox-regulated ATPase YchF [Rhodobiaceae bacterium]|nr:MAG: Ribosome-binding ATPase YchF [Rhodobiaceae bacterium UBA7378]HCQ81339.1 redox-regulated ATPase YchF [Rhodobiaceae bacterium]|tara:strand:+ start:1218 stop:2315 length:1098 start_codon:yes stop_codon:yes gene_type:complete